MLLTTTFLLYLVIAVLVDARALPHSDLFKRPRLAWAVSLFALALLFAFWFALSWRPVFSAIASIITLVIVVLISDHKYRNVQEPLNFMDFALVPQIWRHPLLYRAEFLHHPLFWGGVLGLLGIIFGWWIFVEISLLSDAHHWTLVIAATLAVALIIAWLFLGPLPERLVQATNRALLPADSARHVADFGLAGSLVAGVIGWRHVAAPERRWPQMRRPAAGEAGPLVLVVQSESFVDLARAGVREVALPGLDNARANAASHGCVTVPVQGAWTLRCEFEFLAGQPLTRFGLDALHPYLRTGHMPRTLAHHLADEGFCTVFAHPFDLRFFNRHAAMPRLGFSELIGEQHFPGVAPEGYYIPDLALAGHLLELAARESGPLFCMAVTMENHNPWDRHRLPGIEDPAEQYLHHLRNADRMIARLVEGIEAANRPAILAFYGDHVPYLPELADPFADTRTDYVVMARRDGRWLTGARRDLHLHELADEVLDTLGRL